MNDRIMAQEKSQPSAELLAVSTAVFVTRRYNVGPMPNFQPPAAVIPAFSGKLMVRTAWTKESGCGPLEPRSRREARRESAHMLTDQSRHLEHGHDAFPLEHDLQGRVGVNIALIFLILETVLLDVSPELLGELGARERL